MALPALVAPGFWRHPKLFRLTAALEQPKVMVGGSLIALWGWCHEYRPSGSLEGLSDAEIASASEWPLDPSRYVAALRTCGWLDSLEVHDFASRQGKKAIENAQAARRMANKREQDRNATVTVANKTVTPFPYPLPLPLPVPSPKTSCSEPAKPPAAEPVAKFDVPVELVNLTLYCTDARLCRLWHELLPAWRLAYPGVDVMAQVRGAHAWEVANPKKRKVDRPKFLGSWLARAQDKPAAQQITDTEAPAKRQTLQVPSSDEGLDPDDPDPFKRPVGNDPLFKNWGKDTGDGPGVHINH